MDTPVHQSWARVADWLRANAPADFALLQPPVSAAELDAAAAEFGVELPADFRRLYEVVNATDPNGNSIGLFPSADDDPMAFGPLALEQVVREWRVQRELLEGGDFAGLEPESASPGVAAEWWNVGWIPFAGNGGGDFYCIDTAPADGGTRGQVITHSHETGVHQVLAPSLAAYLDELADGLEQGRYRYGDEYGLEAV